MSTTVTLECFINSYCSIEVLNGTTILSFNYEIDLDDIDDNDVDQIDEIEHELLLRSFDTNLTIHNSAQIISLVPKPGILYTQTLPPGS